MPASESLSVYEDPEHVEEESLSISQDPDLVEEAEVCEENAVEKRKRPSLWKRARHFLGLRKKKRERQQESTSNSDT